jgi:flagellar biosynthetic protein FlhB
MSEDSGEKTEEPTPHKLREAEKKGQVSKSKDLTSAILMLVAFHMLKFSGVYMWSQMTDIMEKSFNEKTVGHLLHETLFTLIKTMAPMFTANVITAIVVESLQTGFVMSFEPLAPKLDKLNPIEGFKKFFSLKQYVELFKSVIKMIVVVWLIISVIKDEFQMVVISQQLTLWQMMQFVGDLMIKIVTRLGIFYFIIGILDFFYQKYEYIKGLKMSKKEIKDEYKRLEGDPLIKQRQREAQRQMAQGRQMGAVPAADVVVTNPVHLAIAIVYKANRMKAPKVIAKGERLIAEEIKRIAKEHQVPLVENKPLAQSLFKLTDIGKEVPPDYYKAVAEILAFVYNLKKKKKHRY